MHSKTIATQITAATPATMITIILSSSSFLPLNLFRPLLGSLLATLRYVGSMVVITSPSVVDSVGNVSVVTAAGSVEFPVTPWLVL